jgi:hypothetical protein
MSGSVFSRLSLVGAAVPPRDPNGDEGEEHEEDGGDDDDDREPFAISTASRLTTLRITLPAFMRENLLLRHAAAVRACSRA